MLSLILACTPPQPPPPAPVEELAMLQVEPALSPTLHTVAIVSGPPDAALAAHMPELKTWVALGAQASHAVMPGTGTCPGAVTRSGSGRLADLHLICIDPAAPLSAAQLEAVLHSDARLHILLTPEPTPGLPETELQVWGAAAALHRQGGEVGLPEGTALLVTMQERATQLEIFDADGRIEKAWLGAAAGGTTVVPWGGDWWTGPRREGWNELGFDARSWQRLRLPIEGGADPMVLRRVFVVEHAFSALSVQAQLGEGAQIWLNGVEILFTRQGAGLLTSAIDPGLVLPGPNLLAVSVAGQRERLDLTLRASP